MTPPREGDGHVHLAGRLNALSGPEAAALLETTEQGIYGVIDILPSGKVEHAAWNGSKWAADDWTEEDDD